jgi:hypothetical protein
MSILEALSADPGSLLRAQQVKTMLRVHHATLELSLNATRDAIFAKTIRHAYLKAYESG